MYSATDDRSTRPATFLSPVRFAGLVDPDDAEMVIFDLDGTLVHLSVDWEAFRARCAAFLDEEVLPGGPDRSATWTLAQLRDRGDEAAIEKLLEVLRSFELSGAIGSEPIDAGIGMFHRANDGRPIAVVTNNTRPAAQEALRRHGLRPHVDTLVALEDVEAHKPAPEGLERVLSIHDVDPSAVLFVGDGDKDATAARRAGVDFVDVRDLEDAGPG